MAMGIRDGEQAPLWVVTSDLPKSPGHPFFARLNALLDANDFDRFVEKKCQSFYAKVMGRPSLTPGRYFRLLLLGYFEGIDSERGIAWRATDSVDPNAKVRKTKDGRTHMAHKAEHAVDLETGAVVAVTLQGADQGDTTTIVETLSAAATQIEAAQAKVDDPQPLEEVVADKGYHSNQTMVDLDAVEIRSYMAEPDRGRRDWSKTPEAQAPVYGNRRRIRGARGRRLMRRRGETVERSFAHVYGTGGMRRTHLRGHPNILKRLLIHVSGFNLGLIMRQMIGVGTPRGLQGRTATVLATLFVLLGVPRRRLALICIWHRSTDVMRDRLSSTTLFVNSSEKA